MGLIHGDLGEGLKSMPEACGMGVLVSHDVARAGLMWVRAYNSDKQKNISTWDWFTGMVGVVEYARGM